MEQGRTKRVKTSATRVRRREVGLPSTRTAATPTTHLSCKKPVWQIQGANPRDCSWVKENFDPTERNTDLAQPTVYDLRFMYAVKNNYFHFTHVDYLHIDVSDTIIVEYTDKDHLVVNESVHVKRNTLESSLHVHVLMRTTCANKSLKIINKSTCLSLLIGT
ncbi:hypothetical protein Lal_00044278 [Lupinus albus]|nr:hypothetical protein Lal_00044278 [Lupinus albus]